LPIRLQRRKPPAALQVLAVTELSLSPYDKYGRVALCMATDKVDEPARYGSFFNLDCSKVFKLLLPGI
jgi:hypothetical protein